MKIVSCVILILCAVDKAIECYEQLDESAWMDTYGVDKYFEYSDMVTKNNEEYQLHEEVPKTTVKVLNIDICTPKTGNHLNYPTQSQPVRRHAKHQNWNIIDILLNTVEKIVKPTRGQAKNETTKGLDMRFEAPNHSFIPSFGNNQDLQLIYLGTKWCGSGDIAKDEKDVGYFYLTGS